MLLVLLQSRKGCCCRISSIEIRICLLFYIVVVHFHERAWYWYDTTEQRLKSWKRSFRGALNPLWALSKKIASHFAFLLAEICLEKRRRGFYSRDMHLLLFPLIITLHSLSAYMYVSAFYSILLLFNKHMRMFEAKVKIPDGIKRFGSHKNVVSFPL